MPQSQPSKPVGLPNGLSPDSEESNLWKLGVDDSMVPSEMHDPAAGEPGAMVDLRSLPKRENRKKAEVHIGIQSKDIAAGDGSQRMQDRRMESEFGVLDVFNEDDRTSVRAGAGFSPGTENRSKYSGVEEFVAESEAEAAVANSVADGIAVVDDKPGRATIGTVEWVAMGILGVLLVGLAVGAYFWSIRLLPEETPRWKSVDFPVKGSRIEIKHAATYWREPVLEGPNKDSVRRGVRLMPVVEMDLSGGPVALRVIFRDDEGRSMGDPIFRAVSSSGKLALASTAGFDDPGMHAAYRTEDLEPWTVEISEAGTLDAPGSAYTQILKMNISPELR